MTTGTLKEKLQTGTPGHKWRPRHFQRNCLRIVLGTRLTDRISNSRLYEWCGSISLSKAIKKERLRWHGQVKRMKNDRLPNIYPFWQTTATRKAGRPRMEWEDVRKKDLKKWERPSRVHRGRLWIDWDEARAFVAMLTSGGLVLRWVVSSSSSTISFFVAWPQTCSGQTLLHHLCLNLSLLSNIPRLK